MSARAKTPGPVFRTKPGQPRICLTHVLQAFHRYSVEAHHARDWLSMARWVDASEESRQRWLAEARSHAGYARGHWRDLCELLERDPRKLDIFDQFILGRALP